MPPRVRSEIATSLFGEAEPWPSKDMLQGEPRAFASLCVSVLSLMSDPSLLPGHLPDLHLSESAAVPEIGNDLNLRNKRVPAAAAGGRASCSRTSVSPHPRPGRGHGSPAPLLSTSEVAGRPTQWLDVLTTCPETSRLYNGASQWGHTCNPSQGAEAGGLQVRV